MASIKRIQKELRDVRNHPVETISIELEDDALNVWNCTIAAASDSPYAKGKFKFVIKFPETFPFKAPEVAFQTKIYHPGINEKGEICIPVLRDDWKPTVSITSVLEIIKEKLNNPSPDDPYEPDIAAQLKDNKTKFLSTAKEWTKKHAA